MATIVRWEDADFNWNKADYTWDDVQLIEEIAGSGDTSPTSIRKKIDKLDQEKKKKLVHLIMKRNGIKVYDKSKFVKEDIKINIKDVEMIIKEVMAQIKMENTHV